MAARFAPLRSTIWSDPDFTALDRVDQQAYFLIISQPDMSFAGVVPYIPKRWAHMSGDATIEDIEASVAALCAGRFVFVDYETDELMVRTFVEHNKIWEQKQIHKALVRDYESILSTDLRRFFYAEQTADVKALVGSPPEALPLAHPLAIPEGSGNTDLDLDLDLHRFHDRERDPSPAAVPQAHALLAPGCDPSLFIEVDQHIASLLDSHPVANVDAAVQRLIDDRRRFQFPSQARTALETILGPSTTPRPEWLVAAEENARADRQNQAEGMAALAALSAIEPDVELNLSKVAQVREQLRSTVAGRAG